MTVTSNLSTSGRRALRAAAHHLDPVVMIGDKGLSPSVLHEIDLALTAHALIKVRVFADDREVREAFLAEICTKLSCASVQHLGKLLVLWRNVDGADAVDAEADAAAITAAQGRRRTPPAADAAPVARGPRSKLPGPRDGNERTPRPAYGARNDAGGASSRRRDGAPSGPRSYGQGAPAGNASERGGAGDGERRRYGQQTWDTGPAPRPGWAPRDRRGDARAGGQTGGDDRGAGFGGEGRAPRSRAPEGAGTGGSTGGSRDGRSSYGGAGAGSGGSGYRGGDRGGASGAGGYGGSAGGAAPRGRWGSRDSGGAGSGGAGGGSSGYRGGGESGGAGSSYRGGARGGSGSGGVYGGRGGAGGSGGSSGSGSGYGGNRDGFTGKPRGFAPRGGGASGGSGSAPPRARRRLG
jgi:putative YhbY family RNA-binding protein